MTIKAVVFDLDDTLIVDEAVSKEAFAELAAEAVAFGADAKKFQHAAMTLSRKLWSEGPCHEFCRRIGISAFECLWGAFEGESRELTALRNWATDYRRSVFERALREQMIESSEAARQLTSSFESMRRKLQRLMPDAVETLANLSQSYQLALLTNGAPDLQREKLRHSGLGDFFQYVAVSGEHDIGKPDPGIFSIVLSRLGVKAEETVMVGNSLERDIQGAKNAGVLAVWLKVIGAEEPADIEPDYTIEGLTELPGLLKKLAAS
jgi:putative hydrolase of the HAD superfamily